MSDIQQELAELRSQIARLQKQVDGLATPEAVEKSPRESLNISFQAILEQTLAREEKTVGIAMMRGAILKDGNGTGTSTGVWTITDVSELPAEQYLVEKAASLPVAPVALRLMRHMLERFMRGESMRATGTQLAADLGVDAAELDPALRLLIAREWVRWSKSAAGEDDYELIRGDDALALLTLV